jgi:hypothetical protein
MVHHGGWVYWAWLAVQQTQVAGAGARKFDQNIRDSEGKMERVNSKGTGHKKFSGGIASLRIVAATVFLVSAAAVSPAHAQTTKIQQSEVSLVPASDADEHDSVGSATAISNSGNTMVVGAENADGAQVGAGAAFVFDKINGNWVRTASLFADDGRAVPLPDGKFRNDSYAESVAISTDGNTVIVGSPNHNHSGQGNTGAVYVFQRMKGVWSQQAELRSPNPSIFDFFGAGQGGGGIGISGDTIVVTDDGNFTSIPGSVDVFKRINGVWTFSTQLLVPDDFNFIPSSLAIDGNTVAVGSSFSDAPNAFFAGVAYVFRFDEGKWSAPVTVAAADATTGGSFGFSVSLSGNTLAVGANTQPGTTAQSGAAYVFSSDEGKWTQKAKLMASDGLDFDNFGCAISVSGQTVFVGADLHTPPANSVAGAAYIYQNADGIWRQVAELAPSDTAISGGGEYGIAVAVGNNSLVVGADQARPAPEGYNGGEVYVYQLRGN